LRAFPHPRSFRDSLLLQPATRHGLAVPLTYMYCRYVPQAAAAGAAFRFGAQCDVESAVREPSHRAARLPSGVGGERPYRLRRSRQGVNKMGCRYDEGKRVWKRPDCMLARAGGDVPATFRQQYAGGSRLVRSRCIPPPHPRPPVLVRPRDLSSVFNLHNPTSNQSISASLTAPW
jgi:hypothetical protein